MSLISRLLLFLLIVGFLGTLGSTYASSTSVSSSTDLGISKAAGMAFSEKGNGLSVSGQSEGFESAGCTVQIKTSKVKLTSGI